MARRLSYSRWDGTQVGFELDADDIMSQLNDDLLYHGDLNAALRKMMQNGFTDKNGERVAGMQELLQKLRERRQQRLEDNNLGGVYDEVNDALSELLETERDAINDIVEKARNSGDQRRQETAEGMAMEKNLSLDFLPQDLAGKVRELGNYDFASNEAAQKFEELMDKLRQQLMENMLGDMSKAIKDMTPEDMARMKDMYADLNNLVNMHNEGKDTQSAFENFMDKFGDFFPGNPESLEELLAQMAQQMAAMQQMMNSMTPEQRAQMQELSDQLMGDMDLRWQVEQLGQGLQQAFPNLNWGKGYDFQGENSMGMGEGMGLMQELGNIDQLENLMRNASNPGALAEADIDIARNLLGDDGAKSLEKLAELTKMLEQAGLVENKEGRLELTPRGMRRIGANALNELFSKLARNELGRHQIERIGVGSERSYQTKPYEFGDPFNLSIERTIRNALARGGRSTTGGVKLTPDDFEIEQTETLVRSSTVLMLDLSLSMPMRDNFLSAKKVAMALHSLISSMYPRDFLGIVGFSETAYEIKPEKLPEVSWDFVYGTNMQHAFLLSRRMLAKQSGTKQIIMITDGEPTAHILPNGEPFFSYPPVRETVEATLTEVARCTKEGITINTFMLDATSYLKAFIGRITEMNRGRAFYTTPETLGDYVLVDFIQNKKEMSKGRR
jgi:uncharacterized protein with von Willebrand factor type A (vWA) domain